ncbi:MAG: VWA domain-containing protein [Deltaproteobacteria bacterium]|nr:VWA domain-containing protein [Deltaproteobacteria bacterium]
MRNFFQLAIMTLLLSFITIPVTGHAAGKTNLMLIFDTSGSMWGQIDGKAKITIAKEAMDLIVNDLPDDINIGLVAYGHRRKGDCDDVEILIPLGPLDSETFLAKVNSLNPKGKTPMVRSIRKTADAIKHLEDETTILLVSDGEETCDPDPCGFVAGLERLGIKFVLHVVGFDVGGQTEAQLKCMAREGGGEYFPAKDADKLKNALDMVIKKTVAKNLVIEAFAENNTPVSAWVNVMDQSGKIIDSDGGRRVSFGLAPGTYTITVKPETMTETKTFQDITITGDQVTHRKVVFAKSRIIVTLKDGSGENIPGYIRIVDMKTGQYAEEGDHDGETSAFTVSPGDYQVDMECSNTGKRVKSEQFTLHAGESKNVTGTCANAKIGVLVLGADNQPITGYIRIVNVPLDVYEDEADSRSTMRFFEVPPGKYIVDVECPDESRLRSLPFDLSQGQENSLTLNCSTKVIKMSLGEDARFDATKSTVSMTPKNLPEQTTREPMPQTAAQSPQDMQSMADQMESVAEAQAAAAQAAAMARIQEVMGVMQGNQLPQPPQTPEQQAEGSSKDTQGSTRSVDVVLPRVADSQAGYSRQRQLPPGEGAQHIDQVGAPPPNVDYSNVGAEDTGGGLTEADERPEQGHNPYEGMSKEEMQAAFARDMGMQGPQGDGGCNPDEFNVGSPLTTRRHIDTLGYRLDSCEEKARTVERNDILNRIEAARGNLLYLGKRLKKRAPKDELQRLLDQCAQEVHAIQVSVSQI